MDIQGQLMGVLYTLLIGLLNIGVGYVLYLGKIYVGKLQAQTQKIQNEDQRALVESTLAKVENLVKVTVIATEETTGKALKQAFADNKIDKSEILALASQVRDEVYGQLSEDTKTTLSQEIGDVQVYIEKLIENSLKEIKAQ